MISYQNDRGYPHPLCLSVYLTFLQLFCGIGTKIVSSARKYKILIICKDMDVDSVDMQPCMDALVCFVFRILTSMNYVDRTYS